LERVSQIIMFFNSITFIGFFFLILFILWIINWSGKSLLARNITLLIASYYYYSFFNIGFLLILLYVTCINFTTGKILFQKSLKAKKTVLWTSVFLTLLPLIYYKYTLFFLNSLSQFLNIESEIASFKVIILPVGISFFTFQALSYTIDIYRGKIENKSTVLEFALFVSFFPTILSGPIEKARNLLPQIRKYSFTNGDNILQGMVIFIWGLFKKVVIADRLAIYVDWTYNNASYLSGTTISLAILFYSIQIYCDFSGYSDMSLGIAKALGFDVTKNFRQPYFSRTIKDFWRKWHTSLTSWFTEYVYFSLGGNRVKYKVRWMLNISLVFILSGIWHGAAWNFLIWGMIHAIYYLIEKSIGFQNPNLKWNSLKSIVGGIWIFIVTSIAWVFFRADTFEVALYYLSKSMSDYGSLSLGASSFTFVMTLLMVIVFALYEFMVRYKLLCYETVNYKTYLTRNLVITIPLLILIALCGIDSESFVYFQF